MTKEETKVIETLIAQVKKLKRDVKFFSRITVILLAVQLSYFIFRVIFLLTR